MLLAWRKRSPRDAMCLPHRSFPRNYGISTTTSTGPSAGRTNIRSGVARPFRFRCAFFTRATSSIGRSKFFMRWRTARLNGFDIHRTFDFGGNAFAGGFLIRSVMPDFAFSKFDWILARDLRVPDDRLGIAHSDEEPAGQETRPAHSQLSCQFATRTSIASFAESKPCGSVLGRPAASQGFDFFILSDSNRPESWLRELVETMPDEVTGRIGLRGEPSFDFANWSVVARVGDPGIRKFRAFALIQG